MFDFVYSYSYLLVYLYLSSFSFSYTNCENIRWFDRFFKKDQKVIVIDAGHGGSDPGSIKGDILEKDINLKISIQLKRQLEKKGYRVVMTRQEDLSLSLSQRAKLANQSKGDLLVSIHQNSFKDGQVIGIEVYYNNQKETNDQLLAELIQETLVEKTNAADRKARVYNEISDT